MTGQSATATGRELLAAIRREQLSFLAAALAYYAFVSAIPLLLLGLALATALGGESLAEALVAAIPSVLSSDAAAVLEDALTSSAGRGEATVVGLVTLSWSGLRLFRGLDTAFARIYGASRRPSFLEGAVDAGVALVAIGLGVVATIALVGLTPAVPWAGIAGTVGLAVVLTVVFAPLYYVFPEPRLTPREVLPGAVLAGVGWSLLGAAFGLYASIAGSFQLYGVIGGVLLLVTWLYVGGLVLLLGAVLNAVLADRQLQQGPRPDVGQPPSMSDTDDTAEPESPPDVEPLDVETADPEEVERLRRELERFEAEIEDRTVHRDDLEADLRRYVRRRVRRGHARGWGPYLVLGYGTAMTLGAFYFLSGVWAILAMLVVWLSTLGLYALMVLLGLTWTVVGLPGRVLDRVRDFRS